VSAVTGSVRPGTATPAVRRPVGPEALRHAVLLFAALLALGPIFWIVSISLKTKRQFASDPFGLPLHPDVSTYFRVLSDERMLRFITNSVVVTFVSISLVIVCSVLAGYALARIPFRGANVLLMLFILSDAIPLFVVIIPLYVFLGRLGLSNGIWGLVLSYTAMKMGLSVFIMRGFFRSIPSEMEDAASIDGAGTLRTIWSVLLPLAMPGVLVIALFNFVSLWNEYFLAAILLPSQSLFTLPPGLASVFMSRYSTDWPMLAAGLVISILPTVLLFVFASQRIVQGWTVTVK
jgi:ABC-type glycerol-3-phosphate transport system permease component